jgi:DNA polymerase III alpha subunit
MSKFNHLHVHSHYSLLNALPKIPDLVEVDADNGVVRVLERRENKNTHEASR